MSGGAGGAAIRERRADQLLPRADFCVLKIILVVAVHDALHRCYELTLHSVPGNRHVAYRFRPVFKAMLPGYGLIRSGSAPLREDGLRLKPQLKEQQRPHPQRETHARTSL